MPGTFVFDVQGVI